MPDLTFMYRGSYRNAGGHLIPGIPYCLTKTYTADSGTGIGDGDWDGGGEEQDVIEYPSTARTTQIVILDKDSADIEVRVHFLSAADGDPMGNGNYVPLRKKNSTVTFNVAHRRVYITIVNRNDTTTAGDEVELLFVSELSGYEQDVIYESGDGLG
jgi:hypothetical protein